MTVSIHTLGCKLNQTESETLAIAFRSHGYEIVPEDQNPDIFVVNTCTVTSMAEQKARGFIRHAAKSAICVLVCGCYARLDGKKIEQLSDNVFVIDIKDWSTVFSEIAERFHLQPSTLPSNPSTLDSVHHSRAFLKIQDGCDRLCSYCRVRLARGRSVSTSAEEALVRLRAFENAGYTEAVLTGVNLNLYRDRDEDLAGLLRSLLKGTEKIRLRLSSLEPEAVTMDLAEALAHRRVRPHFHLSVQSGSDSVLRCMRRPYTAALVHEKAALLRSIKDDPFLACDIIAGFPGETQADFDHTYELCVRVGFAWIHAFPFSPRPGTEAFDIPCRVNDGEVARRISHLTKLARTGRRVYVARCLERGGKMEAIVERSRDSFPKDCVAAVSENYLKLLVHLPRGETYVPGSIVSVRLTALSASPFDAYAELVSVSDTDTNKDAR
ncbi:MAG: tRNA (N(6)-L-threonylcarbamoyladenosine(37)-C(2))-methylthiotransferase MtaB [Treponema sp.]|jgi:threonylcarbamoyladenosine tRNA methylthiotransferase MtaB|nr:tRNA (N(6)-L-threonylcarbamoyladenosine(37)-C(2))-methylthiotransferase MtaB [Treponema sp.]